MRPLRFLHQPYPDRDCRRWSFVAGGTRLTIVKRRGLELCCCLCTESSGPAEHAAPPMIRVRSAPRYSAHRQPRAEIADRAFELCVPEQQLNGSQIARLLVNLRYLG